MELCSCFSISARPPNSHPKLVLRLGFTRISNSLRVRVSLLDSLQNETLKTLEWNSVCQQLSSFTSTTTGISIARNGGLRLGQSRDESQKLLNQTTAAILFPAKLDFTGIEDVSEIVRSSVIGELATVRELCTVKRTLRSARLLLEQLKQGSLDADDVQRFSPLLEILQDCNFLIELEQKIEFCVDSNLSILLDRASEDLEIIRSERKKNTTDLDSLLKNISARVHQAGGIDRPLATKRRSRMCIGIRASHKNLLPEGIVLDISSSGATYFMEPKEAVELNNMEVKLSNSEKAEEQAILSFLTSDIAEAEVEIKDLLDKILELDLAFARANYAHWINGVCPVLGFESVDIEGIRHPLLLESSRRTMGSFSEGVSEFPVPIDIKIRKGTKVVVISGPNTGGKTASMKTLGLASLMSKAGMYLPAKNKPSLPWFDLVLADIGDHQSLEQSLSTFSGHMSRICKILEVSSEDSLVLIDEIGSGTDPSEGVALSASILHYLKDRVNLAVVTTHYADLSRLKEEDTRFENAAMEFSMETLQPTYRILWGSRGDSNALSIARSIGFNEKVIKGAEKWVEQLVPEKEQERRGLLYQSLMEERNRLEAQARKAASLHSEVMELYHEILEESEDLDLREKGLKAKETQRVQLEIKSAKSQIETVVLDFENQIKMASVDQLNSLLKKAESEIASIVEVYCPTDTVSFRETRSIYTPQVGEQVHVRGFGDKLATVVEAPGEGDEAVLVQTGKIRVRVNKSDIRAIPKSGNDGTSTLQRFRKQTRPRRNLKNGLEENEGGGGATLYGASVQTSKNTVDLRSMRVEEASQHLNMAISARGSGSVIFVIHGMGTGAVKESALDILRKHPRIAKFEQESPMNYGCTVAYIK